MDAAIYLPRTKLSVMALGLAFSVALTSGGAFAATRAERQEQRALRDAAAAKTKRNGGIKGAMQTGLMKVANGAAAVQYVMPSTQLLLRAGHAEQSGHPMRAKVMKACAVGALCAERIAMVTIWPGGPAPMDVHALLSDPVMTPLLIGANMATAPLTVKTFKRAYTTGRLKEIAKQYDTDKDDVARTVEFGIALGISDPEKMDGFLKEMQSARQAGGHGTMAEVAALRVHAQMAEAPKDE